MGSSTRKKKEKKKDFQASTRPRGESLFVANLLQKAKLKVGKAKAKPDNFTDTSFKAKCRSDSSFTLVE